MVSCLLQWSPVTRFSYFTILVPSPLCGMKVNASYVKTWSPILCSVCIFMQWTVQFHSTKEVISLYFEIAVVAYLYNTNHPIMTNFLVKECQLCTREVNCRTFVNILCSIKESTWLCGLNILPADNNHWLSKLLTVYCVNCVVMNYFVAILAFLPGNVCHPEQWWILLVTYVHLPLAMCHILQ